MNPLRILLADDHSLIRKGLRALIERQPGFAVVAEAGDGRQAVELACETKPDIAVMDIAMPNLNGIEAASQIAARLPSTGIVILSMHADESYILRALKAGARAYLLKDSPESDLITAIRSVHSGKAFFSPEISRMLAEDYMRHLQQRGAHDSFELLTPREREVLQLLAEGKTSKTIANVLKLSLHTVETHRSNMLQKLNLGGTPELILYAVRKGVIS